MSSLLAGVGVFVASQRAVQPPADQIPRVIHVNGACDTQGALNADFRLQGFTAVGAPYYASSSGKHLYFDPDCSGAGASPGWLFDSSSPDLSRERDLDLDGRCSYNARVVTAMFSVPPLGAQSWRLACSLGRWWDVALTLVPEFSDVSPARATLSAPVVQRLELPVPAQVRQGRDVPEVLPKNGSQRVALEPSGHVVETPAPTSRRQERPEASKKVHERRSALSIAWASPHLSTALATLLISAATTLACKRRARAAEESLGRARVELGACSAEVARTERKLQAEFRDIVCATEGPCDLCSDFAFHVFDRPSGQGTVLRSIKVKCPGVTHSDITVDLIPNGCSVAIERPKWCGAEAAWKKRFRFHHSEGIFEFAGDLATLEYGFLSLVFRAAAPHQFHLPQPAHEAFDISSTDVGSVLSGTRSEPDSDVSESSCGLSMDEMLPVWNVPSVYARAMPPFPAFPAPPLPHLEEGSRSLYSVPVMPP